MPQKYKELLLKDLSARLPYGVIVSPIDCGKAKLIGFKDGYAILFDLVSQKEYDKPWEIEYIKPYLRPMSSMTEEELHEVQEILGKGVEIREDFIVIVDSSINSFTYLELIAVFKWLLKKHFDFMGLIPKGLAIEVTESNNPYKE
jgi:hypothetical protein